MVKQVCLLKVKDFILDPYGIVSEIVKIEGSKEDDRITVIHTKNGSFNAFSFGYIQLFFNHES